MAHERKRDQQLDTAEKPVHDGLRGRGTVLGYPAIDAFEIGQRPVVEDKLHCTRYEPSRAIRSRASLWDTSLRAGSLLRSRISAT